MQKIRCEEIVKATEGTPICGDLQTEIDHISTDSRKINPGDLFIPLVGEKFDGHNFIESSLELGASAVLTEKEIKPAPGKVIIKVQDTLKALRDIASFYRNQFDIPFVGITGSVGKTSTKDMVASMLSKKWHVLKTEGNFNNEIGLPLTVFQLDHSHETAVLEMGMSGFGEIGRLTSIVKPHIGIITNIGMSHIEKLGSQENILKAKMEIFEGLCPEGLAILNGDDELLCGIKNQLKFRTVFYGMQEGMDYQARCVSMQGEQGVSFQITVGQQDYKVHVPVPGTHNVYNALAAIAVGLELGMPMQDIISGIKSFRSSKMRLNILSYPDIKIINDAYNASPQSMEAAISVLSELSGKKRSVAILGDMLEMGTWAEKAHEDVGKFVASKGIHVVVTVGENARNIAKGALKAGMASSSVVSFSHNTEVKEFLEGFLKTDDVFLVKGSRGMKMEEIVEYLAQDRQEKE